MGDVIILETGCRVPADCVLIQETDLYVDESYYDPNENRPIRKSIADANNIY